MWTSQLTIAGCVLGCWVDGSTKANPVWLRSCYFSSWCPTKNKRMDSVAENVSRPWKHSACFLTDVLSCDSIFLPQWDSDIIPVGTCCLWLLCCAGLAGGGAYPAGSPVLLQEFGEWRHCSRMRLCPVETMRNQFEKTQSLEMMSERHSCFMGRFGMENLMSSCIGQAWYRGEGTPERIRISYTD